MAEWVEKLLILQDKDMRIIKLEDQIASVPNAKVEVAAMLTEAENAVAVGKKDLQEEEKNLKHLEIEVDTLLQKKRSFLAKSAMIKNNEEYRAALHQVEQVNHQISQLEDQELELMEAIEGARATLNQANKKLVASKQRTKEMQLDLDTRLANCQKQVARLQEERQPALAEVAGIAKAMVTRYERLRARGEVSFADRRNFVPVRDEVCDRCRMNVTAQTRMNVRKALLVTCENCGAMLYQEA